MYLVVQFEFKCLFCEIVSTTSLSQIIVPLKSFFVRIETFVKQFDDACLRPNVYYKMQSRRHKKQCKLHRKLLTRQHVINKSLKLTFG